MGMTYADITLTNVHDEGNAKSGFIREADIRTVNVTSIVDTGAMSLVITEDICKELGLSAVDERFARTANGQRVASKVTEPVKIKWKKRFFTGHALVIPGAESVLLGVIPLEGMDLMVNPVNQELVGIHGDKEEFLALSCCV